MNYTKFIGMLENYYSNYETDQKREVVTTYIMQNYKECDLDDLFKTCITEITSKFNKPPDVEMLSNLKSEDIEMRAIKLYDEISRKASQYKNMIIADKAAYHAFLHSAGSLTKFAKREPKEEVWIKKEFIKLYITFSKDRKNLSANKMLNGLSQTNFNPIMIGSEEVCQNILKCQTPQNLLFESLTKDIKRIED